MVDYIENLNEEQKIAFLSILSYIAFSDGMCDKSEIDFIKTVATSYGIPNEEQYKIIKQKSESEILEVAKVIIDRKAKLNLIKEIFSIAYADGDMSQDEMAAAAKIGQALNITMEKMQEISMWVIESISLQERAQVVFEEF